ncbi:Hypothetical protein I5071_65270 [Sandaracinus amylolyticus]|nr:Hypothetical protein I5071_65270 [Sandaracinus amylolyticus]
MRRDGQRRRDAIVEAALALFVERGIAGTGIEDVRRRASASPSSIYHQFDGLPGVVAAVLARIFDELFASLTERVCATRTARTAVIALVDAHLAWVIEHPGEARVMYEGTSMALPAAHASALAEHKAAQLTAIAAHVAPFVERGVLPEWPLPVLDVVLLGTSHEACRRWLAGAPLDPAWMRRTLPKLAWQSLDAR